MSEVPDGVPGAQSAFPLTIIFLQAEKEAAGLLGTGRHEAVVSPGVTQTSMLPPVGVSQALFPHQRGSHATSAIWRPQRPT